MRPSRGSPRQRREVRRKHPDPPAGGHGHPHRRIGRQAPQLRRADLHHRARRDRAAGTHEIAAGPQSACAMALAAPALALDTPNERITLAGLTGVHVVVYDVGGEGERAGLGPAASRRNWSSGSARPGSAPSARARRSNRRAGRRSSFGSNWCPPTTAPPLYLYSVDLGLRQQIQLARNRTIESFASDVERPPGGGRGGGRGRGRRPRRDPRQGGAVRRRVAGRQPRLREARPCPSRCGPSAIRWSADIRLSGERDKMVSVMLSGLFAGLAGVLYAIQNKFAAPDFVLFLISARLRPPRPQSLSFEGGRRRWRPTTPGHQLEADDPGQDQTDAGEPGAASRLRRARRSPAARCPPPRSPSRLRRLFQPATPAWQCRAEPCSTTMAASVHTLGQRRVNPSRVLEPDRPAHFQHARDDQQEPVHAPSVLLSLDLTTCRASLPGCARCAADSLARRSPPVHDP